MRSTFRRWLVASLLVPLGLVFTAGVLANSFCQGFD